MVLRHASRWLALISPRYSTCRCATRPSVRRRFSTRFQYSWALPSFTRRLQRRNMRGTLRSASTRRKDQCLHYKRFADRALCGSSTCVSEGAEIPGKQRRVEKVGLAGSITGTEYVIDGGTVPTA